MHASNVLLSRAAADAALAQAIDKDVGFGVGAFSTRNKDIQNRAVVNAHVGVGDNVLEV